MSARPASIPSRHTALFVVSTLFVASTLAIAALALPSVAHARGTASNELGRGTLVYTSQAYVMGPQSQLEAINLTTGKRIWRSPNAAYPLIVHQGSLLTVSSDGDIVALNPGSGNLVKKCSAGLKLGYADTLSGTNSVHAYTSGGQVIVEWSTTTKWSGGVAPPPGWKSTSSSGKLRVTLPTCTVKAISASTSTPRDDAIPTSNKDGVQRFGPYVADGHKITVEKIVTPQGASVRLVQDKDGKILNKTLYASSNKVVNLSVSRDGRHIVVTVPSGDRFTCTIYDSSGSKVGGAAEHIANFVVRGRIIVQVSGNAVTGRDLGNGRQLWTYKSSGKGSYSGPFPPAIRRAPGPRRK